MFEKILASSPEFQNFQNQVKRSKQGHSFLISGKDGETLSEMANLFAKALLCPDLCGECENCKKIQKKSHPDVKYFPEGQKLLVEDSKKIVDESFTKPIFADKKIFVIQNIDLSTEEAQNKLLKSLEEPNDGVFFVLTSTNLENVLPTIKSRCNKIELKPISKSQILPFLEGDELANEIALKLGEGYVSKSIMLSKNSHLPQIAEIATTILSGLSSSKEAVKWVRRILDLKNDIPLLIELIGTIIEETMKAKISKNDFQTDLSSYKAEIEKISKTLSLKCLSSLCGVLNKALKDLSYNVNLSLVVDNLVMNILEVKYLCK